MEKITVDQIQNHVGHEVTVSGWLYNLRNSAKVVFPILRDGTGFLQCVASQNKLPAELYTTIANLTQESSIVVTGKIRAEQRAPGGFELDINNLEVMQRVPETDPYPIAAKVHSVDFLMDYRHLWLRSRRQTAILRIRHSIISSVQAFLCGRGFTLVSTPILSNFAFNSNLTAFSFQSDVFGTEAYLSQTGQPYLEAAAMALGNVYNVGPVFSAEISATGRHLAESWVAEVEMPFAGLEDVEKVTQELISFVIYVLFDVTKNELDVLERDQDKLGECLGNPFNSVSYDQAFRIIKAAGSDTPYEDAFSGVDKTILTNGISRPLIVEQYPFSSLDCKLFQASASRSEVAQNFTVLAPEGYGAIISGGERICDHDCLMGILQSDSPLIGWYADLRNYGTVPHAGFTLHIERMVAWICGIQHIHETIPFPRMVGRLWQ